MKKEKQNMLPPIKEGEEYNLNVEGFGVKGDAFGKVEDFVIFINNSRSLVEGNMYRVKINRVLNKYAFADVIGQ